MTHIPPPQARTPAAPAPLPEYIPPYFQYADDDGIDLVECARLLYRHRRLMAAIVMAAGLLALLAALVMPPVYRAEVLLAPVTQSKGEGVASVLGQLGDLGALFEAYVGSSKDRTAESIATLKSRSLTTQFIAQHELKPILFNDRWEARTKTWREGAKVPTDLEAVDRFDKNVRQVVVDRRTGLVTLAIEWGEPALAAAWANALVREVNTRRREEAIDEAKTSIAYLQRQLARNSAMEIHQAIYRLIEAQTKTMTVAATREEYAFRVIDPAVAPEMRIRPKRTLMVLGGLVVGVVIAVFVVLLRHALTKLNRAARREA